LLENKSNQQPANTSTVVADTGRASDAVRDRAAPDTGGSGRTWVLVAEGVVAAGGLAMGIGFLAAAGSEQNRFDQANDRIVAAMRNGENCINNPSPMLKSDCDTLPAAFADHSKDRNLAIAGFAAAGAGAIAFATTLIVWKTPSRVEAGIRVAPRISETERGISMMLRY
jgi:hypothetical protein